MTIQRITSVFIGLFFLLLSPSAFAQNDAKIEPVQVSDQIYMLTGPGGNLGLFIGEDGTFLIDDQFAPPTLRYVSQFSVKP